jgi:hypothetical protein
VVRFLIMKHLFNFLESLIEKIFIIIAFIILTPMGWIGMLIIATIMGWID